MVFSGCPIRRQPKIDFCLKTCYFLMVLFETIENRCPRNHEIDNFRQVLKGFLVPEKLKKGSLGRAFGDANDLWRIQKGFKTQWYFNDFGLAMIKQKLDKGILNKIALSRYWKLPAARNPPADITYVCLYLTKLDKSKHPALRVMSNQRKLRGSAATARKDAENSNGEALKTENSSSW